MIIVLLVCSLVLVLAGAHTHQKGVPPTPTPELSLWKSSTAHFFLIFFSNSRPCNIYRLILCSPRSTFGTLTCLPDSTLKALFNNVFTLKKSELHGPKWYQCLWYGVKNEALKNCTSKASLSASKE